MPPGLRPIRLLLISLAAAVAAAVPVRPQLPELEETVEVRVVNVDVVVTDADGRLVRGLEREDFRLWVNGRPASIDYFSAIENRRPVDASPGAAPAYTDSAPFLAIAYDGRALQPPQARAAVEELRSQLDRLLASSRAVMVVRQGARLVVEQPFTRDRQLVDEALDRLLTRRVVSFDLGERRLLMKRIEGTDPPRLAAFEAEDDQVVEQARRLLQEIRNQAQMERFEVASAAEQLRSLVRSLGGLPGRKSVLYLGEGLRTRPAEPLYRVWWAKYNRWADQLGIYNIESEISLTRSDTRLTGLVEEANAHRVSFFSYDPGGLRTLGGSVEYSSVAASERTADERDARLETLVELALATGGIGRIDSGDVGGLLDEMLAGFDSYYSLGFEPTEADTGRVRVELREPGLRLRYLRRFAARTAAQELEESTLAALMTEMADNELQVAVELGAAARQPDGTFLVPVLVKVPVARLALLPRQSHHVGQLSFVILAQSADGDLSPPARGEVPIEIANGEMLSAMGRSAGYRLQMRVAEGEQRIAIGVRDEIARLDSVVSVRLDPRRGSGR